MRQIWILVCAVGAVIPATGFGQTPDPGFEVASVKPSKPDDLRGTVYGFDPSGVVVRNGTLRGIIQMAFEVPDFEVFGAPGWIDAERYDILGKAAVEGQGQERIRELRKRLRTLLAERFQLQTHRETKEIPEYTLVIAKNGPKLKPVAEAGTGPSGIQGGCVDLTGTQATMAGLAYVLTRQLQHPVSDRTGLSGKYDFKIEFSPDAGGCKPGFEQPADASDRPSIFTALQETLGLKLESGKGPFQVLVIDRVERATAN